MIFCINTKAEMQSNYTKTIYPYSTKIFRFFSNTQDIIHIFSFKEENFSQLWEISQAHQEANTWLLKMFQLVDFLKMGKHSVSLCSAHCELTFFTLNAKSP